MTYRRNNAGPVLRLRNRLGGRRGLGSAWIGIGICPKGAVLADQGPADLMVRVVAQSRGPAVTTVDTVLRLPPAPAAFGAAGLCSLPAFQAALCLVVAAWVIVGDVVAVDRPWVDAHVDAAGRLCFSVGRFDGRFPVAYGGVPAPVLLFYRHFTRDSFPQLSGHSDAAQIG